MYSPLSMYEPYLLKVALQRLEGGRVGLQFILEVLSRGARRALARVFLIKVLWVGGKVDGWSMPRVLWFIIIILLLLVVVVVSGDVV